MSADKHFVLDMENALELTKPCALGWQQIKRKTQQIRDCFDLLTRNAIYVNEDS